MSQAGAAMNSKNPAGAGHIGGRWAPADFWDWAIPEPNSGCWLWQGQTMPVGYGRYRPIGAPQKVLAHRHAYTLAVGVIPDGLLVCHKCDNPSCINPDHLYCGTPQDNMNDKVRRGRGVNQNSLRTHCRKGHPLVDGNLYARTGTNWRRCRTCHAEYSRRRYAAMANRKMRT